jgi:hypothetical protein
MAVLIAFLLGENSPFVGGPFHVADTVEVRNVTKMNLREIMVNIFEMLANF